MRILLTNDDGIRAPGIRAMHDALIDLEGRHDGALGDVFTVAPATVQSATSHGVTFHEPLMIADTLVHDAMRGVAVDGRPADCVKLALTNIWPERHGEGARPDLVVSGMNAGANVGINVIYSGTVAAALEAAFLGVPSIAVSLHIGDRKPRWDVAARHAREAIDQILAASPDGLPAHTCISVNVPVTETDTPMPPLFVCPMNTHGHNDKFERRVSPAGDVYYWAAGHGLDFRGSEVGADVEALFAKKITVTPLRYDLTQTADLEMWRSRLAGAPAAR
jgi:5'-nucleotidase